MARIFSDLMATLFPLRWLNNTCRFLLWSLFKKKQKRIGRVLKLTTYHSWIPINDVDKTLVASVGPIRIIARGLPVFTPLPY
jgi:hypothetical protein